MDSQFNEKLKKKILAGEEGGAREGIWFTGGVLNCLLPRFSVFFYVNLYFCKIPLLRIPMTPPLNKKRSTCMDACS